MAEQISRNEKIAFLVLIGLIFISTYAVYPYRTPGGFAYPSPGPFQMIIEENSAIDTRSTPGHDSILQLQTAHWIADGKLDKNNWKIALGYSILLIPFVSSIHAFLIPDLLMFVGVMYCMYGLAIKISDKTIARISVVALLAFTGFLYYFVEPEKQHVNEFGFMVIAYWLYGASDRISKYKIISIGLILGWVFWSDYVDIIYFIPLMGIFLIQKLRKQIIWLFPSIILILSLFALQYHIFGTPFSYGVEYQNFIINYAQNQTIPYIQNLEGVKVMSFDPHIILKRAYCMLFEPNKCQPISYGISYVDEYNKSLIPGKRAILAGSTGFFALAPYGFIRTVLNLSGYEKRILLLLLACFVVGISFWISIFMWHAGGSPFWRYEMVWYPLVTIFSIIGVGDLYKRIMSTLRKKNSKNTESGL